MGTTFREPCHPTHWHLRKRSVFECFPYVCPEPVLVKCSFLDRYGISKRPFLFSHTVNGRHSVWHEDALCRPGFSPVILRKTRAAFPPTTLLVSALSLSWQNVTIFLHSRRLSKWSSKGVFFRLRNSALQSSLGSQCALRKTKFAETSFSQLPMSIPIMSW